MPKVSVDECPAGPEMDAAVARTLGLEYEHGHLGIYVFRERKPDETSDEYEARCLYRPSADIAAAWIPFEKLMHVGATLGWTRDWLIPYVNLPVPDSVAEEDLRCYGTVYGSDHAEAISRAFLKAHGVEEIEVGG